MKVRWTTSSLRLRITPSELEALLEEKPVQIELALPGDVRWRVMLGTDSETTHLTSAEGEVQVFLAPADRERLSEPDAEGVYFQTEATPPLRYFVEKDFPCAHPRLVDTLEAAHETFAPTPGFEERKSIAS